MLTEILSGIGDGNPGKKYIMDNCNLTKKKIDFTKNIVNHTPGNMALDDFSSRGRRNGIIIVFVWFGCL